MGITRFSGPVYGAKSLLWSAHRDNQLPAANDTTTVVINRVRVPAYEDWFLTELQVHRGSSGATAVTTTYELTDDSTVVADLATTSSVTGLMLSTILTVTPGEYEGYQALANSTLAFQIRHGGSSVAISSVVTMSLYGFVRYNDSTRAV